MFACLRIIAMSPVRVDRHPLSGGSVLDSHLAALNTSWLPRLSTLSEGPGGREAGEHPPGRDRLSTACLL